jgi:hypothetical protein
MMTRLLVALGTALVFAGPSFAEPPPAAPPEKPAPVADEKPALVPEGCCSGHCGTGGADGQFWAVGEYLFAWFSGDRLPALVTTSPSGTAQATAGIPGFSTTATLFGDRIVNDNLRTGFRLDFGYWLHPERTFGVEAGFMMLESQAQAFAAASGGTPILARPFINSNTAQPASLLVAFPGSSTGTVSARARSGEFYDAHFDLTENVIDTGWVRLDSLFGYRFYRYDEGLRIRQSIANNPLFAPGTQFAGEDDFATQNIYHGADLGFRTLLGNDDFSLGLLTKLGVGRLSRSVNIIGGQLATVPGVAPSLRTGNLLALPSNIGRRHTDDWTVLPEVGATLGWQAGRNVRVTVGYSVLWLDRIARAADQIDFVVNPTHLPNATVPPTATQRPTFVFIRSDAWIQSLSLGLEFSF